MTADIAERLRALSIDYSVQEGGFTDDGTMLREAADELEQLRALLRAIMDDTSDGQESMSFDIRDRIERALEPKP